MPRTWHIEIEIKAAGPELVEATARVPHDSLFFDGHFPDHSVLPGIAMLAMVEQAVERGLDGFFATGFKRVRFRKAIGEGGSFGITLSPNPKRPGRYMFKLSYGGEKACDGQVLVEARP